MGLLFLHDSPSLLNRQEDLSENATKDILKSFELLIASFYHIVDGFHDFLGIVSVFFSSKAYLFGLGYLTYQIILSFSFVIDRRDLVPKCDVWVFYFSLRILIA